MRSMNLLLSRFVAFFIPILFSALLAAPSALNAQTWWNENFDDFNEDLYFVQGNRTYYDQNNHYFVLTPPEGSLAGRIYNVQQVPSAVFVAEFDIRIGGGNGADGMDFAWVRDYEYPPTGGGAHDFNQADGYAVEFDCYNNGGIDPNGQHIGIMHNDYQHHLATWQANEGDIEDNQWHHVKVTNVFGDMKIWFDDELVLEHQIEDYDVFEGYFGFTAGTGGANNWHILDNVDIQVGGPQMALSRQVIEFGPVAVDGSKDLVLRISNNAEGEEEWRNLNFTISDEGEGVDWLEADPVEDQVLPGEFADVMLTASTAELETGEYERTLFLETNDPDYLRVEMPVHIFVVDGSGRVSGVVTDESNGNPIAGVTISDDRFDLSTLTDENGTYEFADLAAFNYNFLLLKEDYLPLEGEVEVSTGDDLEVNFSLLHSELLPGDGAVELSLAFDDTLNVPLTLSNPGNGPLTWSCLLDFPDELELDPWSLRHQYPVSEEVEDDRIQAVTFAGNQIYLAGSASLRKLIYVLDRDGALVDTFPQLSQARYGFTGLTFDGELLWGAGEQTIYGFSPEGDSVTSFQGPFNPTSNAAWDAENEWIWLSGTTTNITATDREGNVQRTLNRRNMRIYGLGFYPDDPDGYKLYVFTNPSDTAKVVIKMNTENGDTVRVLDLPPGPGRPAGCAITKQYDPFAWVFMGVINNGANDFLNVWHLSANTGWIVASPLSGMIDAGDSENLDLRFDTHGLAPDLVYETIIRFTHDGIGGTTEVPVSLTVTGVGGLTQRLISLAVGWNLVSTNLTPENGNDFAGLMSQLTDENFLILAKDGYGNFFWPDHDFDGINGWETGNGYWLKVNGSCNLRLMGEGTASEMPIPLESGWNTVSYFPRTPIEPSVALSGLGGNLVIARDGTGRFYLPTYNFSDMDRMREGMGYQLKVTGDADLIYSLNGGDSFEKRYSHSDLAWLNEMTRTSSMTSILVVCDLPIGTHLEARTPEGQIAGRGVVGDDGLAGLTLFGDDPETKQVEGFVENESFEIFVAGNDVAASWKSVDGTNVFTNSGWGVVALESAEAPRSFGLTGAYPNPFNSTLTVKYFVSEQPRQARLALYDLTGREALRIIDGVVTGGGHRVALDCATISSGVYIVRLETLSNTSSMKVVLVK